MKCLEERKPGSVTQASWAAVILRAWLGWAAMTAIAHGNEEAPAVDNGVPPSGDEITLWFPVGESFEYSLRWGVIPVGTATMETEWQTIDGRRVLVIRGHARTGRIVERIYPIENHVKTVVDPETFLPLSYRQRVREGRRRRHETTIFHHAKGYADYKCHRKNKTEKIEIHDNTRDLLTFFYAARREGMQSGETATYQVLVDDDIYDLTLTAQESERISLPEYGRVRGLRIEPTAKFGEVFVRRGRMWAWLSNDDRRVCMQLSADLPVANVHAVLVRVRGPGDDHWVKEP